MWKGIEKFFNWIADHTGISWIARKISSGWKWLFSSKANAAQKNISPKRPSDENVNKSPTVSTPDQSIQNETEESVSKTDINVELIKNFPEKSNDEPKAVGEIKFKDNQFYLSLNRSLAEGEYKNLNNTVNLLTKLLVYVKCGKNEYKIVGYGNDFNNIISVHIESITKKNEDGRYLSCNAISSRKENTYRIKETLGLENGVTKVKVDNISNQPFEGTALEQHNLNPTTAQQTVNNEEVTTETEEFYDAKEELDDDFHDAEEVETKTLSIVPIKKSQDNSIVINGVIIPERAKLKFFPELSNFLSRASSEREKLFCKVVPSSLFIQPKTAEQIAGNDRSC